MIDIGPNLLEAIKFLVLGCALTCCYFFIFKIFR
jgi:hypothetical protein